MHLFALFFLLYTVTNVPPTESYWRGPKPQWIFYNASTRIVYPKVADYYFPHLGNSTGKGTTTPSDVTLPVKANVIKGSVVLVNGFRVGMAAIAFKDGIELNIKKLEMYSPLKAEFYTGAYRWFLRHLANVADSFGGLYNYAEAHKVWRRRYSYTESLIPKWARYFIPWVKQEDWDNEEKNLKSYLKFADRTFGRYRYYPHKKSTCSFSSQNVSTQSESSQVCPNKNTFLI